MRSTPEARRALSDVEAALCARLRGAPVPVTGAMADAAGRHRVHLLLAATLGPGEQAESPDVQRLRRELRAAAAIDAAQERPIGRLLDAWAAAGVSALVFKGLGVAHLLYPAPYLRPRADIDVLVPERELQRAEPVLLDDGWIRPVEREVAITAAQRHYEKSGPAGTTLHLDLHWKIANPRVFADVLPFDDVRARARPIPALGTAARTLCAVDALLVACVHRVAHHADRVDLLWLWDIHLLIERLTASERDEFTRAAISSSMAAVCARGIELAAICFETRGAAAIVDALQHPVNHERSTMFLDVPSQIRVLQSDLSALPNWRSRLVLLREHLFPSIAYMRGRHPGWPAVTLPLAYVYRIVRGAPAWLRPPRG